MVFGRRGLRRCILPYCLLYVPRRVILPSMGFRYGFSSALAVCEHPMESPYQIAPHAKALELDSAPVLKGTARLVGAPAGGTGCAGLGLGSLVSGQPAEPGAVSSGREAWTWRWQPPSR